MIIIQINSVIIQIRSFPSFPIFCPYHHWHRQLHTILYVSLAPSKKKPYEPPIITKSIQYHWKLRTMFGSSNSLTLVWKVVLVWNNYHSYEPLNHLGTFCIQKEIICLPMVPKLPTVSKIR